MSLRKTRAGTKSSQLLTLSYCNAYAGLPMVDSIQSMTANMQGTAAILRAVASRTLLFAVCWWAITEGEPSSWGVGGVAVIAALYLSLRLRPPRRLRVVALLQFIPLFLWRSLAGGLDVARRALSPAMPLQPALREFRTVLPAGLPRVVFANVVSLLPGTLCADLVEDRLCLHVLSDAADNEEDLRRLERGVARIFPEN
jgi:multicomponent Na+:H+ antiporter subunit E